ncbi:MAG: hypothetical protein GXY41_07990 [Phycisphaerae bacterium]|nr:hypothetical protein [Phycisphaerae bacterium]
MNKDRITRIVITFVIVGVLAVLWGKQSDLAYNVAQQRAILLGRYTLETMITLLTVTPILLCVLYGLWKKQTPQTPAEKRQGTFKLIALIVSILLAVVFVDVAMRLVRQQAVYVGDEQSYHRTPNQVHTGVFRDRPEFAFSYPNATPGYPDVAYTLTVDERGFRNPMRHEQYDWIVLGDSFAEGSSVTDEDVWTVRLAERRGVRIYNLGMSGGSPVTYLDTLQKFGVEMKPKVALYMLYEGNDLRDSNFRALRMEGKKKTSLSDRIFKASPLRHLIKASLVRTLGPVGRKRFSDAPAVHDPSHLMYPVAWLPIEIPAGGGYSYAFDVKRLEQHYITEEAFRATIAYAESLRLLEEAKQVCDAHGIALIFIYAPDAPSVLIEDILDRVPAEQLHAFMATRLKRLPDPETLVEELREGTQVRERIFRQFCAEKGIPFLSLTEPLRQKTQEGVRTYYTYDQHWTPDGHAAIAEYLSEHIPPTAE